MNYPALIIVCSAASVFGIWQQSFSAGAFIAIVGLFILAIKEEAK